MTTLRHEVRIEAPVEAVWSAISDLEAVRHYNPMVAAVRIISAAPTGVGAARRCDLKPKGQVEERVWKWAAPRSIGLEVAASDWPIVFMRWETTLEPQSRATVVRQQMDYRLRFGPLGAVLDAMMMRRKLDGAVRDVFANLKRYVESGGQSAT
jgi:uncharacterized protein YndB with AHSA1/START domain